MMILPVYCTNNRGVHVDITIYLPDEIAHRAKDSGVNLSRMLRDALNEQFEKEEKMAQTLSGAEEYILDLIDQKADRRYKGRFSGTQIATDGRWRIFLKESGDVIAYDSDEHRFATIEDPETELVGTLPAGEYLAAMDALGVVPTISI
jgi:hypothetical protein